MERKNTALPSSQTHRPMSGTSTSRGHAATRNGTNTGIRLFKGDSGCRRMYIGHFQGTEAPVYKKSKLLSLRAEAMQTKIERVQNNPHLKNNKKKLDEEIRRLKFHENKKKQDFFFEFTETQGKERRYLGKPKPPDNSFTYAVIEVDDQKNMGYVYPASYMDFALESQMVASGDNITADSVQKAYLKDWKRTQKKHLDSNKSMSQILGNLFGHSDDKNDNAKKKKKLGANELREEIADLVNDPKNSNSPSLDISKKKKGDRSDEEIDDKDDFNVMRKSRSKRIKRNKTRGGMDELPDFDEFFSDDEDETNLRDMDMVDDSESDHFFSNDEWDGDSSEDDEHFNKLSKLQHEDVENKDYEVKETTAEGGDKKEKPKKSKYDSSSDEDSGDEDDGAWFDISDEDDDEDADTSAATSRVSASSTAPHSASTSALMSSRRSNRKRPLDKSNQSGSGGNGASPNGKRRKLNNSLRKTGNSNPNESLSVEQVVAIFRRHGNHGISTNDLFSKLGAIYSIDQNSLKSQLVGILKQVATVRDKHWFLRKHLQ